MWDAMVDILGAAATATLIRRSSRRAVGRAVELHALVVSREGFEYSVSIPESWRVRTAESVEAVRELARELSPLLIELTGPVVIRRLSAIPELQDSAILFQEQKE